MIGPITYRSPANSAKSSVRLRRSPPRKRLGFCQMICRHSWICSSNIPRSSVVNVWAPFISESCDWVAASCLGWEPQFNLNEMVGNIHQSTVFEREIGRNHQCTYVSGCWGGLSRITSNLSMSNIIWRTVARIRKTNINMNIEINMKVRHEAIWWSYHKHRRDCGLL